MHTLTLTFAEEGKVKPCLDAIKKLNVPGFTVEPMVLDLEDLFDKPAQTAIKLRFETSAELDIFFALQQIRDIYNQHRT